MKERSKEKFKKADAEQKLFDSGKEILLGTNKYPNKK
jgi:methylmalonyl-CoA mutase